MVVLVVEVVMKSVLLCYVEKNDGGVRKEWLMMSWAGMNAIIFISPVFPSSTIVRFRSQNDRHFLSSVRICARPFPQWSRGPLNG